MAWGSNQDDGWGRSDERRAGGPLPAFQVPSKAKQSKASKKKQRETQRERERQRRKVIRPESDLRGRPSLEPGLLAEMCSAERAKGVFARALPSRSRSDLYAWLAGVMGENRLLHPRSESSAAWADSQVVCHMERWTRGGTLKGGTADFFRRPARCSRRLMIEWPSWKGSWHKRRLGTELSSASESLLSSGYAGDRRGILGA